MQAGATQKLDTKHFEYPSPFVVALLRGFAYLSSKIFWSINFCGLENIPPVGSGGLIVASNHPTYFDPAWISIKLKRPLRFMAWDRAFEWRFVGPLIRYLGAFPVRLNSRPAKSSIVESLRTLRDGATLVIFPEGEREFSDGKMHEFKAGTLHIAMNAGVPVLPVSIKGGNRVWPQGQKYPRFFHHVDVTFHPIMQVSEPPAGIPVDEHLEMQNQELMRVIASGL